MTRRYDALIAGGFPYLVAEVEDVVAGYAYAGRYRARPAYRFTVENSVYLDPAAQGQRHRHAADAGADRRIEKRGYRLMVAVIGDSANAASIGVHTRDRLSDGRHAPNVGLEVRPLARHGDDAAPLGEGASTIRT